MLLVFPLCQSLSSEAGVIFEYRCGSLLLPLPVRIRDFFLKSQSNALRDVPLSFSLAFLSRSSTVMGCSEAADRIAASAPCAATVLTAPCET